MSSLGSCKRLGELVRRDESHSKVNIYFYEVTPGDNVRITDNVFRLGQVYLLTEVRVIGGIEYCHLVGGSGGGWVNNSWCVTL
jgi:hypothetical protein